jgi:hypothetical protein
MQYSRYVGRDEVPHDANAMRMSPTRIRNVSWGVGLERVEHLPGGDL